MSETPTIEEIQPEEKKPSALWTFAKFVIKIGFAGGIIFYLVYQNYDKFSEVLRDYRSFDYLWILLGVGLFTSHLFVGALRWWILMRMQKIQVTLFEAISLMMQGFFFSLAIPGGALGGDVIKAAFLAKRSDKGNRLEGAFTILMDRIVGMIGLFTITSVVGVLGFSILRKMEGMFEVVVLAIFFGCFAGLGTVVVLFFHQQFKRIPLVNRMMDLADQHSKGMVTRLETALDMYKNAYWTIAGLIVMTALFIHLNVVMVVCCLAKGIGVQNLSFQTMTLAVCIGNTAGLIPLTPSGVGTRDAVIETLLRAGGIPGGQAIAVPLIYTIVILSFYVIGGIFFICDRKRKKKPDNSDECQA